MKLKVFIFSLLLTVVLTFFSGHWYLKSDYWKQRTPIQETAYAHLTLDDNDSKSDETRFVLTKSVNYLNLYSDQKFVSFAHDVRFENKKITFMPIISFYPDEQKYNIKIISNVNNKLFMQIPLGTSMGTKIEYKSFLINNQEQLGNFKNNSLTFNVAKGDIINLQITAKRTPPPVKNVFKYINIIALICTAAIYFAISYMFFSYIFKKTKEELISTLMNFAEKNKISLSLFLVFFIFYMCANYYAGTHINFLDKFWVMTGDNNAQITNIVYGTTKRFHPYHFLPFYPIYDFLVLITKNIMVSIFLIYATVTSLSVALLYKILEKINENAKTLNILITLILGFSWCYILFSYSYDVYMFSAFYLTLIIYLIIKELKHPSQTYTRAIIIALLAAFSFGVTISNIATILILLIPIFFLKNNLKKTAVILISFILLSLGCIGLKGATCHGLSWKHTFYSNTSSEKTRWVSYDYKQNLKNFKRHSLREPVCLHNKHFSNTFLYFWLGLVLLGLMASFSKNVSLNDKKLLYAIAIALIYNFFTNFFWSSHAGLLFTPNHFVMWFILMGYSFKFIDIYLKKYNISLTGNKFIYALFIIFIILLLKNNYKENKILQKYKLKQHPITNNLMKIK